MTPYEIHEALVRAGLNCWLTVPGRKPTRCMQVSVHGPNKYGIPVGVYVRNAEGTWVRADDTRMDDSARTSHAPRALGERS